MNQSCLIFDPTYDATFEVLKIRRKHKSAPYPEKNSSLKESLERLLNTMGEARAVPAHPEAFDLWFSVPDSMKPAENCKCIAPANAPRAHIEISMPPHQCMVDFAGYQYEISFIEVRKSKNSKWGTCRSKNRAARKSTKKIPPAAVKRKP